jgi:hypothetical protein
MTISEKVAYLKGLSEGMKLDTSSDQGKLFSVVIEILEDVAADLEDLNDNALDLGEEIDELSDDLAALEDIVYEDEEDECEDDDEEDSEDDDGCCCCCEDDAEPLFFEVKCPTCSNEISVDEDVLAQGTISCPNCGEKLEFDFDEDDEDAEDNEE